MRSAAFDDASNTLLLSDSSRLAAIAWPSRMLLWSTPAGSFKASMGIAVLPSRGHVAVTSWSADLLHVHRLSDGERLGSVASRRCSHIATADTAAVPSGTVYVSEERGVFAFSITAEGLPLPVKMGKVQAACVGPADTSYRVLAVMPPSRPGGSPHLVAAAWGGRELAVVSLTGHELVHTHALDFSVVGMASDPSGAALALSDSTSRAVRVLPWPLTGMPPL